MTAKATLNGNITAAGGENEDQRGFEWGTQTGVYPNSWTESGSYGTGAYTHDVTGLTEDITIFYRAKAHNSAGWGYGSEQSFQTWKGILPTDTGAGSEAPSLSSGFTSVDSGIGAEADVPIGFTLAETGSGSESSLDFQCAVPVTDAGSGSETSLGYESTFTVTDVNVPSDEIVLLGEYKDVFDSVVGDDVVVMTATLDTITDSGQGLDAWSLDVAFTIGDNSADSETIALDMAFTSSDVGSGVDAASLSVSMSLSDIGSGTDFLASIEVTFAITDLGAGADAQSLTVYITGSEFPIGVDAVTGISATFTVMDTTTGTDTPVPVASFTVSDSAGLSNETWTLLGQPLVTDGGIVFELFSKDFGVLDDAVGAEFAWRLKGSVLVGAVTPPHVLSIRITDETVMSTRQVQGGSLPKQKMIGKPGRVVEIKGWTKVQADIDDMEALKDGVVRMFLHPSGDSFSVLVTDFNPEARVDEYDRRIYRLTLKEVR